MARVAFTANLRRHREAPEAEAEGATVREVLDRVFRGDPLLRSYILDEQGRLRRHVNVFVTGRMIRTGGASATLWGPTTRSTCSRRFREGERMSDGLFVATRKGLFAFRRLDGGWTAGTPAFLGEPVSAVLEDPRDGSVYAALNLGHFGCKLHRSDDGGMSWQELPAPAYPAQPEAGDDAPALQMIWTLAAGGPDAPGEIWAGTLPGGLFVSRDRGESWTLVEALWDKPERKRMVRRRL